ncbi:MAG: PRC-barrel domain-containing protein [Luteolibacter sp.]
MTNFQNSFSAFVTCLMFCSATAQERVEQKDGQLELNRDRRADQLNGAAKASEIMGMTVKNYQAQVIGKVEDLAVDVESGRIVQVVISSGGFIGIDKVLSAVPPSAFHHEIAAKVLRLDADKEMLRDAPDFDLSRWADFNDSDHLARIYHHYHEEGAFGFISYDDAVIYGMIPMTRLMHVQNATELMGALVRNSKNEVLGQVKDILLDMGAGRIVAVVVSSGGFLGMGDELSAFPPTALKFTEDRKHLLLDANKEMLVAAPHFKSNEWPDFAEPLYTSGIYRAFKVEPYFKQNADNTALNARDRDGRSLTPFDQGNDQADIDTTARIRSRIIASKGISFNGKNIKIMTKNGHVTLRGPVDKDGERLLIEDIATRFARIGNVDNQLEVTDASHGD